MDPVSLSLSIAGILPLVATALKSARSYMTTVLNAKQSITILITELQALQVSLKSLNELLSSAALGTTGIKFHSSSVLLSCSAACDAQLRSLCEKLRCESKGRMSRYLWPLSEKEHKETVQQLRNFTNWMQFALSIDGCRLLSRTSDDVVRVMSQQLDQFKSVQALESSIPQLYDAVQEQSQILRDNANSKTRRNILDWISTAKYDQKHHVLQSSRARNTGNWILHRVEYHCWKDGSSLSNVLWCHGAQGSGKTNLTSIIIDEILESTSSSTCPLAFIYFDYQEHKIQTPLMVWSSILRQLVEMISNGRKSIIDRYENAHHLTKSLSLHECERMILDLVQSLECAYLVIDAIDECDGSRFRRSILQFLDHLVKTSKVRVLVTSRPHIQDIHSMFCQSPQIKTEAQKEDLKTYLREELLSGGMYSIADEDFANKVIRALTARAEGMFLLPVLQVRTILNEPTLGDMEDRLEELSGNLGQAFEETIARIKRQPGNRSHIGLVVIDPETTDVRPAHYTIQEYLVGHSEQLFPRAEAEIASSCLKYLLFEDFEDGPLATEDEI
ncbi:hypothetical protein NUW58_g9099 [Xylaria curta]|uniref:Uncharacterized protein n=1 Tax=Xylaria curta TaxID=42375 RepID=A0ACC1N1P4_9PEZI|nr:hypothetical protein NUW58_g9099 [Xylaria curta]